MLAFRNALAAHYEEIEGDAWVIRKDQTVIYHDATISPARCPGPYAGRRIRELTLAQVRSIRCQGQPIPTEQALLRLVATSPDRATVLMLETKSYPGQPAASARAWAELVSGEDVTAGLTARTIMQDFDWNGIEGYHIAAPKLRVSALISRISKSAVVKAAQLGAYDVSYDAAYSTRTINAYISAHHLVPTVWDIDAVPTRPGPPSSAVALATIRRFRHLACQGVKVIITNYSAIVVEARAEPQTCAG